MKKAILLLLVGGCFSAAFSQDKALLYEVTGKGLAQPSYLYGTFHLVCPADLKFTPSITKAMSESKQLYLEIDMDAPALQTTLMTSMMFTPGKSLRDFMSADDYAVLDRYLAQTLGTGLSQLGMLKPVALLGFMYRGLLSCEPVSYDLEFAEIAGRENKEILGFETIEQQIALFDKVPIEIQAKGLAEIARKPNEAREEITTLLAAYKAQDLPQLMKLTRESEFDKDDPEFMDEILARRNANWIPVIEKAAQQKSTFFAFGAAHLGGPAGVVNLLRARGYSVKPTP
jgi:uncharacterized protein YbaP (TraB family)